MKSGDGRLRRNGKLKMENYRCNPKRGLGALLRELAPKATEGCVRSAESLIDNDKKFTAV